MDLKQLGIKAIQSPYDSAIFRDNDKQFSNIQPFPCENPICSSPNCFGPTWGRPPDRRWKLGDGLQRQQWRWVLGLEGWSWRGAEAIQLRGACAAEFAKKDQLIATKTWHTPSPIGQGLTWFACWTWFSKLVYFLEGVKAVEGADNHGKCPKWLTHSYWWLFIDVMTSSDGVTVSQCFLQIDGPHFWSNKWPV